jgi:hypothetical protein
MAWNSGHYYRNFLENKSQLHLEMPILNHGSQCEGNMMYHIYVIALLRLFCFYIVSGETASRPKKRLMRTYHWISLFMSYIKSAN